MKTPTLIIGAGPAGLAVAGRLRHSGQDFEIVEQTDKIASSWHGHYERLCLHTVKQLSHLPHLPFPDHYPLYVPREDLVRYYEDYARHFKIQPYFDTPVQTVRRKGQGWEVMTEPGRSFEADRVVIATGVNRVPFSPQWEGMADFTGDIVHSRLYKNVEPYRGKRVLVVGLGNTGAEVALNLSENDIPVAISVRSPINVVPRDVNGRPVQLTARALNKLPFGLGDWLGTQVRKRIIGDLSPYGVPMSTLSPIEQLRTTGKTPVIDLGTVAHIKEGRIKMLGDIERFTPKGVLLLDGTEEAFDAVILCTGYRAKVEEFVADTEGLLDRFGVPKGPIGQGPQAGLYFVGFDNYKLGGILGTIFNDSETVVEAILAQKS